MYSAIERVPDVTCRALSGLGVLWRAMSRLTGRLLLVDGLTLQMRIIQLQRDPACECCGVKGKKKRLRFRLNSRPSNASCRYSRNDRKRA
jgi:hypothetical protein